MAALTPQNSDGFKDVVLSRFHCKRFTSEAVATETLKQILALTLRAPTSFNSQPYKVVIVKSAAQKESLAATMLGENAEIIRAAPVVAVFCADLEPVKEISRIQQLMRDGTDMPAEVIANHLPMGLKAVSLGFSPRWLQTPLFLIARLLFALVSKFKKPAPDVVGSTAWSYKQVSFAASHMVLAAASFGLGSAIMEGVDGRRARAVLGVPDRYAVPMVVALGSPGMPRRPAPRFEASQIFCDEAFATPLLGIPSKI